MPGRAVVAVLLLENQGRLLKSPDVAEEAAKE